jgi:hypothetical protein
MLRRVMVLVTALVLVLTTAQLALANQPTGQQDTGGTITTQGQNAMPDPAQQGAGQNQQPAGGTQSSTPNADHLTRLNEHNKLIINCPAVSKRLAQFNQLGDTRTTDPQAQSELARVNELAQLCADGGSTPTGSGGNEPTSSNNTGSTQT